MIGKIILAVLTVSLLSACTVAMQPVPEEVQVPDGIKYEQGNWANGGLVTEDRDNIYYSNHNDNASIYVYSKSDGQVKKLEGTDHAIELHLEGDFIYFLGAHESQGLYTYRIRKDGTQKEKVLSVPGNIIYYPQAGENQYIFDVYPEERTAILNKRDGSQRDLIDDFVRATTYDKKGKVWINLDFSDGFYEYNVLEENASVQRVFESTSKVRVYYPQYYKDLIYFVEGSNIYQLNVTDENIELVFSGDDNKFHIFSFLITEEYIFAGVGYDEEARSEIIRIDCKTKQFQTIYDNSKEKYVSDLMGIADGKLFISTSPYPFGTYDFLKVIDFDGNRLDQAFERK